MFSKEWKLVALAVLSVSFLTACPNNNKKKNDGSSPFAGLWINAEAQQELTRFSTSGDRAICDVVLNHPNHFGISASWDGEVSLDAWSISSKGEVYRYTSVARASTQGNGYRERYYVGTVSRGGDFAHRNAHLGLALVPPSSRGSCYQAPFEVGNASLELIGPMLSVQPQGRPYTAYVKVTDKSQLRRLSHALSICTQLVDRARSCYNYRRMHAPAPQPGVELVPPPGPGRFQQRPLGPPVLSEEQG